MGACSRRSRKEPGAYALDRGSRNVLNASSACGRGFYHWLTGAVSLITSTTCHLSLVKQEGFGAGAGKRAEEALSKQSA